MKWKSSLPPPVNMCWTHWEARCASPASVVIWDLAAGIWLFEVTFADPYELPFKAFHLSPSATQKSKSSALVCLFSGILGHLFLFDVFTNLLLSSLEVLFASQPLLPFFIFRCILQVRCLFWSPCVYVRVYEVMPTSRISELAELWVWIRV